MNLPSPGKRTARLPIFFFPLLYLAGAAGYYAMEVAFRGYSHWSRAVCGGLCLCLIFLANRCLFRLPLLFRALVSALIITAVELAAGCLLNLLLGWHVWDYSSLPYNLWGQIAPRFSALWFALSIPVCMLCALLDKTRRRGRTADKQKSRAPRQGNAT